MKNLFLLLVFLACTGYAQTPDVTTTLDSAIKKQTVTLTQGLI